MVLCVCVAREMFIIGRAALSVKFELTPYPKKYVLKFEWRGLEYEFARGYGTE